MKKCKCCMNCVNYDEFTCVAHSQGYEAHVSHPKSYICKDWEYLGDEYLSDELKIDSSEKEEEEEWEW